MERALAIYEKALGPDNPATATSLNNLALLYQRTGANDRALPLYDRALAIREKALGPDHPDTAEGLRNLAVLYQTTGAYDQVLPLIARALVSEESYLSRNLLVGSPSMQRALLDTFQASTDAVLSLALHDLPTHPAAAELAQILLDQFDEPFPLTGGHEVYIGTSIGISIFPDDGSQADEVVRNADAALYRAKEEGRGIYRFYTAALTDKANERLSLERRLRRAIERNEFLLHYQPLVRIKDRRIVGFEALVRWQEPGSGLIPPGKFIPLAEETGIILPLGDWVLREACRQMKIWRDAGHDLGTVAVNLSPRQFHLPDIDSIVGNILQETGLSPHFLELELTESALIEQGVGAEVRLAALRKLGARVSIDDFGTGYSSLAYLKRFPISKLKIDQSFVRDISTDPADMEITSAIIGLARNLHLDSIAEGVETEAQLAYLEEQGCEFAQGYLFSKPLPAEEIDALLRRGVLAAPALSA